MADVKKIADQLVELTVKEVNELLGVLKDENCDSWYPWYSCQLFRF